MEAEEIGTEEYTDQVWAVNTAEQLHAIARDYSRSVPSNMNVVLSNSGTRLTPERFKELAKALHEKEVEFTVYENGDTTSVDFVVGRVKVEMWGLKTAKAKGSIVAGEEWLNNTL